MEVFTLYDCDNLTSFCTAHCNQKANHSRKSYSVKVPQESIMFSSFSIFLKIYANCAEDHLNVSIREAILDSWMLLWKGNNSHMAHVDTVNVFFFIHEEYSLICTIYVVKYHILTVHENWTDQMIVRENIPSVLRQSILVSFCNKIN